MSPYYELAFSQYIWPNKFRHAPKLWDELAVKKNKSFANRTSHTFWKAFSFCLIGDRDGIFAIQKELPRWKCTRIQVAIQPTCFLFWGYKCFLATIPFLVLSQRQWFNSMSALFSIKTDFSNFLNWDFRFQKKHVPLHPSLRLVMSRKRNYLVGIPLKRPLASCSNTVST